MSYKSIVDGNIQDGLIKRIADDILQGIEKVYEKKDISSRRWIWELLQNAKDVPNQFEKVSVKIDLSKDELSFSHNGDPFTTKNLTNLIMQVSSKMEDDDEDDITGKFGTGFLVTHLLSKNLTVDGIVYESDKTPMRFSVNIDREAEKVKDLIIKLNISIDKIKNIDNDDSFVEIPDYFNKRKEADFDTKFTYQLTGPRSFEWAKNGVNDLINTLPLTLIFVRKIKEVIVFNEETNSQIRFELESRKLDHGCLHIVKIIEDGRDDIYQYFWSLNDESERLNVVLRIKSETDFSPIPWDKNTPKIYRDFPLIGSEKFYSPVVFNGHGFYPNEPRIGLLIEDEQSFKVVSNKKLLIKVRELLQTMITQLPNTAKENLFLLALSKVPDEMPKEWYEENIQLPFREFLLEQAIVNNESGLQILKETKFPKAVEKNEDNIKFYNIVKPYLGSSTLPFENELGDWLKIIGNDYDKWNTPLRYSIEDLLKELDEKLISEISFIEQVDIKEWLNELYQFLEEIGQRDLMEEYAIIPNRKDKLCKLSTLFINDGIEDDLLNIYEELKEDYSPKLIMDGVKLPFEGHQTKDNNALAKMINDSIKEDDFDDREDRIFITHSLLKIFPSDEDSFRKTMFFTYCDLFKLDKDIKIIPNIQTNFNFDPILKKALSQQLTQISSLENIYGLSKHLGENNDATVVWLDNFLSAINKKDYSHFLKEENVIPNLYKDFCAFDDIHNNGIEDHPLPDELLKILFEFDSNKDWKKKLILDGIGIKLDKSIKIEELSKEIEEYVKNILNAMLGDGADEKDVTTLMTLIKWTAQNKLLAEEHFRYTLEKKPTINTLRIEDPETQEAMYDFLDSSKEKILSATKLVKNMSVDELNDFANIANEEGVEKMIAMSKLSKYFDEGDIEKLEGIIKGIGIDKILELAERDLEERMDFEFKKRIGDEFEVAFQEAFLSMNLNLDIITTDGPYDYCIRNSNNNKEYYIELKSIGKSWRYIKMHQSQAEFSAEDENRDSYSLCVIRRPRNFDITSEAPIPTDYLIQNMRAVDNIGSMVSQAVELATNFKESLLEGEMNSIGVEFKSNYFHYTVPERIWINAKTFDELIQLIKQKLL